MRTTVTFLVVTLPFAALWSIGCASVGAGLHALARRIGRKPLRVKAFLVGDSASTIERSAALIKSIREAREANDARLAALDEVVADLAASKWPSVGATAEERIESIRRRVDEKLAAKSGGSKDVGPVPIDPGVAGPSVGPVPIDPGAKAPRTWADVRRDQLEVAEEVALLPRPAGWEDMDWKAREIWTCTEEGKRVAEINAAWWKEEDARRESQARGLKALDEIKDEIAGTDWCSGATVEERCAWLRSRVAEKLAEQDARAK